MSPRRLVWIAALFLGASTSALAGDARDDKIQVEQQLNERRAEAALLTNQRVGVLQVLELVQRLALGSAARAALLQTELTALSRRTALAEQQEAQAREDLHQRIAELAPRLKWMYRVSRQNPLDVLLSAQDFAAMVWRWRALGRMVAGDLKRVQAVASAETTQREAAADLEDLRDDLKSRLVSMKAETTRAAQQRRDLEELVGLIHAESQQSNRVIRELEQADRELATMVAELEQGPPTTGFGALRGHLPFPTDGRIEVGFGKVVNPKFNTVTVQKGLDLRAAEGSAIKAVAPGKVVYAGWLRGYGNLIILEHGESYHSLFAHLATLAKQIGDPVQAGDLLGTVGDTGSLKGPYLYFELRQNGMAIDPAPWLKSP